MASQTLNTVIAINAQLGGGIGKAARELTQIGSAVDAISSKLIDFGEDSVEVYRQYEMSMKDAEVALATSYGQGSSQLKEVMSSLDEAATEWAASTIFHTNDVSNAISEAAHAGWDYEQIMTGIPAAMELAQAGGLDLPEAVNYIVKSTNAAGVEFEDLGGFLDSWVYSANSSASTVQEFGDAMLRMGSTMRFTDNTDELMTLIAVTANAGSTGAEAGTLIRNSMLRLIAPTSKAQEAMAELGATTEEAEEAMNDEALAAAYASLETAGFSAYDESGNLKSVLDTYRELYVALGEIAGGYENIQTNQDAMGILSAIFPTRTITEALTLIRAASEDYGGLYDSLQSGDALGYTQYASETMMDSLNGRIETFESKVERLKQVVGGTLADDLSSIMGAMGGFVDSLATMDSGKFGALTGALEVVAAAGPGLMTAGAALRLLAWSLTPIGTAGVAAIGIASLAAATERLKRADLESAFGEMTLDEGQVSAWLASIEGAFGPATEQIDAYAEEVSKSVDTFKRAGSQLSSGLLGAMLSDTEISQKDMQGLADQMYESLVSALDSNAEKKFSIAEYFLGGTDSEGLMQGALDAAYNETYEAAKGAKAQMDQAISDAFSESGEDGSGISEAEYEKIMASMREYNELMARAAAEVADEESQVALQATLHKAQTASLDEIETVSDEINTQMQSEIDRISEEYENTRAQAVVDHEKGRYTDDEFNQVLSDLDSGFADRKGETAAKYSDAIMSLWNTAQSESDNGAGFSYLQELSQQLMSGEIGMEEASKLFRSGAKEKGYDASQLATTLSEQFLAMGGTDTIGSLFDYYNENGDTSHMSQLATLQAMQGISNNWQSVTGASTEGIAGFINTFLGWDHKPKYTLDGSAGSTADLFGYMSNAMYGTNQAAGYTAAQAQQQNAMYGMTAPQATTFTPSYTLSGANLDNGMAGLPAPEIQVPVDAETSAAESKIDALGDKQVDPNVGGNFASLDAGIAARNGQTITVNVSTVGAANLGGGVAKFAEGGRATEASIFGEAGAEWAIPEAHTQRTADLLNAAREASGFTWPELISTYGGLGSKPGSGPTTVVYSPTINANDSSGVEQVLKDDKRRLEKFLTDRQMFDSVEAYA